ncbi:MAG: B12-binding domain-containing radical SAM protein [Candidatus Omnitrophota bacterium]|nr:MAG: B12-binding domain-containing radical SAM protein [Candidatus Omnitrophota bacterium]
MKEITLIFPPSPFLIDDMVMPPLGVLYLAAALKEGGAKVKVIDLSHNAKLPQINTKLVGISATTPQYPYALDIKEKLKKDGHIVAIGGAHSSGLPEVCLRDGFDYAVVGEGERAIFELFDLPDQKIIKSDYIEDVNSIAFPDREALDIHAYKYSIDGLPASTMITSRGCPYSCAFCGNSVWGRKLRLRSPENIFREAEELKKKGFEAIMFFDDIFTLKKDRVLEVCNKLRKLELILRVFTRADTIDEEMAAALYQAGCREVGIGSESGSQKILDTTMKGISVEQNTKAIDICRRHGIRVKLFMIIGLPGETKETIEETRAWLKQVRPDDFDLTIFVPLPTSKIYNNPDSYECHFHLDYSKAWFKGIDGKYESLVSTNALSSEEIVKCRDTIYAELKEELYEKCN